MRQSSNDDEIRDEDRSRGRAVPLEIALAHIGECWVAMIVGGPLGGDPTIQQIDPDAQSAFISMISRQFTSMIWMLINDNGGLSIAHMGL
jgi:hypothetical protein